MAKARSRTASGGLARTRRVWPWLALLLAVGGALAWMQWGGELRRASVVDTAYAARVACSCRYVAGRSIEDCGKDRLAGMDLVRLSDDGDARAVTASVPLIASDTARYRDGYGCVLKAWED